MVTPGSVILAVFSFLDTFPGGPGQVDGNRDNRANSAQFQLKLPTELGNIV